VQPSFFGNIYKKNDSTIFLAEENGNMIGFTQLYPSFSSVSMKRIWILNDLFVAEVYRKQGVAKQLMDTAEAFVREAGGYIWCFLPKFLTQSHDRSTNPVAISETRSSIIILCPFNDLPN
jgi:GNAT superfamily N-acetyltransferase